MRWHVDDFLETHVDEKVKHELVSWFDMKYGKETPVSVRRGRKHDYLGMKVNFSQKGKMRVTMFNYITEILNEALEAFTGTASTPVSKHLFDTDDNASKLEEKKATAFHHIVAKSLFLAKGARTTYNSPWHSYTPESEPPINKTGMI